MGAAQPEKAIEPQIERDAMLRACALARQASGAVAPNPMVGCVLMQAPDSIVGEGWHIGPGGDHAELMALKEAGDAARNAVVFVTLEPCNHTGRTGPCTQALIDASVGEVVYAIGDPNPIAAGGAKRLRQAGIKVRNGLCAAEARELNRAWLHCLDHKRPYVIGKSAMSLDGRIATSAGESQWITSELSRNAGHSLRREADAVLVGAETVIADDPSLTARLDGATQFPLRVVLDSTARTSPGAKVYERSGKGAILITTKAAPAERITAFRKMGVETLMLSAGENGRPCLSDVLDALYERDVHTLLLEGGGAVLGSFFDADLIDELRLFIAPLIIGGGKSAFNGRGIEFLQDAGRFTFEQQKVEGPDIYLRGVRKISSSMERG